MGGNALSVPTERLYRVDFFLTQEKFVNHVEQFGLVEEEDFHFVRPYNTKETHGDMDVLIKKGTVDKWDLVDSFDYQDRYNNGDVVSLDWTSEWRKPFQLDLVFMREEWWDMAKAFFAYNDLGNLMGKTARWLGLKYGFQGLRATHYSENRSVKLGEKTLSTNPKKVFETLGFKWDRFQQGFETLEDVFEYVVESEFFNKAAFMPENLTADQRHRDTKRKTYVSWMDYLQDVSDSENQERPTKKYVTTRVNNMLGVDLKTWKDRLDAEYEQTKKAREVFNGNVVMENFNLHGKELGQALSSFKEQFETTNEFHEYLLDVGREQALADFQKANDL